MIIIQPRSWDQVRFMLPRTIGIVCWKCCPSQVLHHNSRAFLALRSVWWHIVLHFIFPCFIHTCLWIILTIVTFCFFFYNMLLRWNFKLWDVDAESLESKNNSDHVMRKIVYERFTITTPIIFKIGHLIVNTVLSDLCAFYLDKNINLRELISLLSSAKTFSIL